MIAVSPKGPTLRRKFATLEFASHDNLALALELGTRLGNMYTYGTATTVRAAILRPTATSQFTYKHPEVDAKATLL
ncbi:hypothetical protein G7Y89_g2178 [Cudoniella acicularis]|uniref:Uncharacterized protein n=1 Tax=Cudoniella acicularis TaxID=354080 RepID=A0A8H4RTS6_9HELO|nr:hypothetical protein G7Y89_g2178 [Cudoniella acicularis]